MAGAVVGPVPFRDARAPARSAISGSRSRISKTWLKLTSAVCTLSCRLVSWAIGAYSRISKVTMATSVPIWSVPLMTSQPPKP